MSDTPTTHLEHALRGASDTLSAFMADDELMAAVIRFAQEAEATLRRGGKLLSCGNGGSMCDAMHFAEEWTGRFRGDRPAPPALQTTLSRRLTSVASRRLFFRNVILHILHIEKAPCDSAEKQRAGGS